jgi:hypothetical protein
LSDLGRISSTQTIFLHQVIAQTVGLNATDTKCLDLILRSPGETLTAGQLAAMTGLTTGAITHIIDRLEKRGFAERHRDPTDRRKVNLRVVQGNLAPLAPKYELVAERHMAFVEQYSTDQLLLIADYLEKRCAVSQKTLAEMIAVIRAPKGR